MSLLPNMKKMYKALLRTAWVALMLPLTVCHSSAQSALGQLQTIYGGSLPYFAPPAMPSGPSEPAVNSYSKFDAADNNRNFSGSMDNYAEALRQRSAQQLRQGNFEAAERLCRRAAKVAGQGTGQCTQSADKKVAERKAEVEARLESARQTWQAVAASPPVAAQRMDDLKSRATPLLKVAPPIPNLRDAVASVPDRSGNQGLAFGTGARPQALTKVGGLTAAEWAEARECQNAIDRLAAVWPVPRQNIELLEKNLARRNELWQKAITVDGLQPEDRERMRLLLHTPGLMAAPPQYAAPSNAALIQLKTTPSPMPAEVNPMFGGSEADFEMSLNDFHADKAVKWMEYKAKNYAEFLQEGAGKTFSNLLPLGKLCYSAASKSEGAVRADAADFMVGMLQTPRATMAKEGGKIYANYTLRLADNFLHSTTDFINANGGRMYHEDIPLIWSDVQKKQEPVLRYLGIVK